MKKTIFILPFLICIFSESRACENVNLFESNPRLLETKIVNQGNMNTCYAHTLGDLYNIEKTNSLDDSLHPYWVAYNHKKRFIHWSPRNLNYSLLSWSYSDIKKNGICSYQLVESKLQSIKQGIRYSNDQLLYMLRSFFANKPFHLHNTSRSYNKVLEQTLKSLEKKANQFEMNWKKEDLEKILVPLRNQVFHKTFFDFLGESVFNDCSIVNYPNDKLINSGRAFESNARVQNQIEMALSQNKAIALGYCPKKVYKVDPSTTKDLNTFPRITRSFSPDCGAHYSLLVGSKKVAGRCQILLRNSYGENFWGHPGMKYWCQDQNGHQRDCAKEENNPDLKVLGAWIDSSKLSANTYDVSYFE